MANPASPSLWSLPESVFSPALIDRFWSHVKIGDDCWLWTGERKSNRYGMYELIVLGKRTRFRAHRFSFEQVYGPIEGGLLVCHRCDVRLCVRPDHLFCGTM